jgi:hypothetical protein
LPEQNTSLNALRASQDAGASNYCRKISLPRHVCAAATAFIIFLPYGSQVVDATGKNRSAYKRSRQSLLAIIKR